MIKLSDVKVWPQYRTWVRHRLVVLEYAWAHGPAAAGRHYRISARTIRRWRKRWRAAGVEGLVPSYPRHRPRRVPPPALELIRHARQELSYGAATDAPAAAARAQGPAGHGNDSTRVP